MDFVNIHHLELFYYVAKYEGITAAVRKMPYGIQQPAVSGQILHLEKDLGVKLFNRRPFALTPAGEELYDYLYPFFSRLSDVEGAVEGGGESAFYGSRHRPRCCGINCRMSWRRCGSRSRICA